MAIKKHFDAVVPVQLEQSWKDRIKAVSDHPKIQDSLAAVIRDCIETSLPGFELELGIRELDDLDEDELAALGLNKIPEQAPAKREDRARGSFGYEERQG